MNQLSLRRSVCLPNQGGRHRSVSSGPAPRFEDDHRRLGRPSDRVRVEPRIDRDPALPQPLTLLARRRACAHQARLLVRQPNDGVRVRLEVAPPRGMALVPAVHRDRDEVRTVFEVANDDAALFPEFRPMVVRRSAPSRACSTWSTGTAATEPVPRAMNAPGRVHEPRRRVFRRPGCCIAHRRSSRTGRPSKVLELTGRQIEQHQIEPVESDDRARRARHQGASHEAVGGNVLVAGEPGGRCERPEQRRPRRGIGAPMVRVPRPRGSWAARPGTG